MRIAFAFAVRVDMSSSSSWESMSRFGSTSWLADAVSALPFPLPLAFVSGFVVMEVVLDVPFVTAAFPPPRATKSTLIISASPVSTVYGNSLKRNTCCGAASSEDCMCLSPSLPLASYVGS